MRASVSFWNSVPTRGSTASTTRSSSGAATTTRWRRTRPGRPLHGPSHAHHGFPAEQALRSDDEHDEDEDERHGDLEVEADERDVHRGQVLQHADHPRRDDDADRAGETAEDDGGQR